MVKCLAQGGGGGIREGERERKGHRTKCDMLKMQLRHSLFFHHPSMIFLTTALSKMADSQIVPGTIVRNDVCVRDISGQTYLQGNDVVHSVSLPCPVP